MTSRIQLPPHLAAKPFSRAQADRAGIARGRLRGPDIRHPFPGVNSAADAIGIVARSCAFAVRMPPHAFFCSVTAAVIMRVPLPQSLELRGKLHVGVPFPHLWTIERSRARSLTCESSWFRPASQVWSPTLRSPRDGTQYRGDFAFPREKVIVECQSEYHSETEQFRRDMTRIANLPADGWYVMQVNADDLRNPRELTDRIRHVLSQRSVIA
ncbi:endonuclease domain-containing protein [Homoserinimonas sp. A447]